MDEYSVFYNDSGQRYESLLTVKATSEEHARKVFFKKMGVGENDLSIDDIVLVDEGQEVP